MKVQIGDLVQYCIRSESIVLLEGLGLVVKKAAPDIDHFEKHTREINESWIVYTKDRFWFIREIYFIKLYKSGHITSTSKLLSRKY
jgi:hypothetical protein